MSTSSEHSLSLRRAWDRGVLLLKRQRNWMSTLTVLTAVLVLGQMLLLFYLGVQGVDTLLSTQAGVRLEILSTAQQSAIQEMFAALNESPLVDHVSYVTKEQAYTEQKSRDPDLVGFLEQYKLDNPFPDTFVVTLRSLDSYDTFRTFIENDRWRSVVNPTFLSAVNDQERQIRSLLQVTDAMHTLSIVFVLVAFVVVLFVVIELVSRSVRAHEDELMLETMLGATPVSVLLPFMVEMSLLLVGALCIATVILFVFVGIVPFFIPALAGEPPYLAFTAAMKPLLLLNFPVLFLFELCVLPAIAYVGTFLGAGRKIVSPVAFLA